MSGRRGTPFDKFTLRESGLWLSDNTIANVSTAKHGLAPKGSGDTTKFFRADWTEAVPPGSGGTSGSGGIAGSAGYMNDVDIIPTSPNADDHEFLNGDTIGGTTLGSPATAPAILNNRLVITGGLLGTTDAKAVVWSFTGAGTPWTVTAKIRLKNIPINYHLCGLLMRNSVSGKFRVIDLFRNPGEFLKVNFINVSSYSSLTNRSGDHGSTAWRQDFAYLRITDNGTNIVAAASEDGLSDNWYDFYADARGTLFTSSQFPDQFGVFADTLTTNTNAIAFFDWIRIS